MQVFRCGAKKDTCEEQGCTWHAETSCEFKLRGRKTGEVCGRRVCIRHIVKGFCPGHYRFLERESKST